MDRLSSCYFCGIALDEPLQDYPLVAGDGEPSAVVTLCPTCRRKLETVLNAVVEEREVDLLELGESDRPELTAGVDGVLAGREPEALTPAEGSAAGATDAEAHGGAEPADRPREEATDTDDPDATGDAGDPPEGATEADVPAEADGDATPAAADAANAADAAVDEPGPDGEAVDPLAAEAADAAEAETTDRGDGDDPGTAGDRAEDADEGGADRGTQVSALEYNKVMRLLQNREFPVQREEIVSIAANAYELSERECAAVIELAVDRGLLTENGGRLDRPD